MHQVKYYNKAVTEYWIHIREAFIKKKCNICYTRVWSPQFKESDFSPLNHHKKQEISQKIGKKKLKNPQ